VAFPGAQRFTLILTATVVGELDRLKVEHRNPDFRAKAEGVINRLKSYRGRGELSRGVLLRPNVSSIKTIALEPNVEETLRWLDFGNDDDRILASFVAEMDMGMPEGVPIVYASPMHPEVVSNEPGSCPKCGMKLFAQAAEETTYVCPMHPEVTSEKPDRCPKCGMKLLPANLVAAGSGHGHEHHHRHGHHEHKHEGHHDHGHHGSHSEHGDRGDHHQHGEPDHKHDAAQGIEWEDDMVDEVEARRPRDRSGERRDRLDVPPQMTWIGWPHSPEVAGSNPAPRYYKGPAKQGLCLLDRHEERDLIPLIPIAKVRLGETFSFRALGVASEGDGYTLARREFTAERGRR
jgi:hypothetical protein